MSYCRFAWGGSDVYVFESAQGIECCGCRFGKTFVTDMPEEMIRHLAQHRRVGHYVPDFAILALWEDVPGAQRPTKPEPSELTKATLVIEKIGIELRIEEVEKSIQAENQKEESAKK